MTIFEVNLRVKLASIMNDLGINNPALEVKVTDKLVEAVRLEAAAKKQPYEKIRDAIKKSEEIVRKEEGLAKIDNDALDHLCLYIEGYLNEHEIFISN